MVQLPAELLNKLIESMQDLCSYMGVTTPHINRSAPTLLLWRFSNLVKMCPEATIVHHFLLCCISDYVRCVGNKIGKCTIVRDTNMDEKAQWQKPIFQELISWVLFEIETRGQVFCIALGPVTICIIISEQFDYFIYFIIQGDIWNAWKRSAPRPIEQISWFLLALGVV